MSRWPTLRYVVPLIAFLFIGASGTSANEQSDAANIEGTWFCKITWAPWFGPVASEMLVNAAAGGTVMTADTDDLTGFNPSLGSTGSFVQGPGFGGWKRARGHAFDMNYSPLGYIGIGPQAGLFAFLSRLRCGMEVHGDLMNGACDADVWWGADQDGDGNLNLANPATTSPDLVIQDLTELTCTRIPVLPKQ